MTLSKNELTRWIYPNTKQSIKWDYYRFPYTAIANIPEDIRFNFDTFNLEQKDEETLLYALYMDSSSQKLQFMYDTLKHDSNIICDFYKDVYRQNCWCLEITSSQATKYSAVQFLRNYGSYEYITGFGDSWNDISLFQACDESYAVANASSKLKAIATATIKKQY